MDNFKAFESVVEYLENEISDSNEVDFTIISKLHVALPFIPTNFCIYYRNNNIRIHNASSIDIGRV